MNATGIVGPAVVRCAGETGRRRERSLPAPTPLLPAVHAHDRVASPSAIGCTVMSEVDEVVVAPQPARVGKDRRQLPSWRWEELRTTLWVVPVILIVISVLLFLVTFEIDLAAFHGHLTLPAWIRTGNA